MRRGYYRKVQVPRFARDDIAVKMLLGGRGEAAQQAVAGEAALRQLTSIGSLFASGSL